MIQKYEPYLKDSWIVKAIFLLIWALSMLSTILFNEREILTMVEIQKEGSAVESILYNIPYYIFYLTPVILLLNTTTGMLLHVPIYERVRNRNRMQYFKVMLYFVLGTAFAYCAIYYRLTNICRSMDALRHLVVPWIRVVNLMLLYVLIGLFAERQINLIGVLVVLAINIRYGGFWTITAKELDDIKLLWNLLFNIGYGTILVLLSWWRYRTMELIKEKK